MRKFPESRWIELGRYVHDERLRIGQGDMKEWAKLVGRSVRQLQGLERGEVVGAKTIDAVAEALGVGNWILFSILTGNTDGDPVARRAEYEAETGFAAMSPPRRLDRFTNEQLLEELAFRLQASDTANAPWRRVPRPLRPLPPIDDEGGDGNAEQQPEPRGPAPKSPAWSFDEDEDQAARGEDTEKPRLSDD